MSDRFLVSGPFRLDLVDERLWRDGEAAPLGGKAFALLRLLMTSPQTLLTKDQLLDEVWGDRAVGESVLTTAIKDLRRALGDDARDPKIIRTVHGRGYTYMLPVEAQAAPDAEPVAPPPQPPRRPGVTPKEVPVHSQLAQFAIELTHVNLRGLQGGEFS